MSSHPSIPCHQQAPIPIMEVQSAAIPAKRGPEDDVQFVSVHPVKKARGSREAPPAPSQVQQTLEQNNAPPQAQIQEAQAHGSPLSHPDAASGPQSESSSMLNRNVSFPGLENYTFPPPPDSKPCQTSRSSPILSPRQLPQNILPNHTQTSQDFRGFVQPPQFQVPWGMSALYPQPAPMNSDVSSSRAMPIPSVQAHNTITSPAMDIDDQPLSMSMALRRPEPPRPSISVPQREAQNVPQHEEAPKIKVGSPTQQKEHASITQAQSSQGARDHDRTNPLPYPSPRQEPPTPAKTPFQEPTRAPTPNVTQPQPQRQSPASVAVNHQNSAIGPDKPAAQQTPPPKGPCVVCEQMRQQILLNQANGLPISHLPQMAHGWHGQGPVTQMPMGHPNAAAFGMMPNMVTNLQQRFQPIALGHLPMGYGMQHIPVQVQMQLQRHVQAQNIHGNEPSQSSPSQHQESQQMQGQQALGQVSQPATNQQAQYMHSQLPATLPQSVMMQRPTMMHQQTLGTPSPPSPQLSPQTTQTTSTSNPTPTPASVLSEPKKQHSPNLIVDIAETCEDLFPWDEVAKRHGVTRVKVVDTFGAIIQLPLLRCTTDKKRHGKLATSRLREYTKAKKDAEANSAASAAKPPTPVSTPLPTSAAPVAQGQSHVAQLQASQQSANQAQNQLRQVQMMQAQAMQAQAMQAQANQMYASQGHINQTQSQPQPSQQLHENQDRSGLPGVFEMSNTFSPLGLPSNLTHGLSGHWQQQQPQ